MSDDATPAKVRLTAELGMAPTLRDAAMAVLVRWESPRWEWTKHGPTADLMADLRFALEADTAAQILSGIAQVQAVHNAYNSGIAAQSAHDAETAAGEHQSNGRKMPNAGNEGPGTATP